MRTNNIPYTQPQYVTDSKTGINPNHEHDVIPVIAVLKIILNVSQYFLISNRLYSIHSSYHLLQKKEAAEDQRPEGNIKKVSVTKINVGLYRIRTCSHPKGHR
ncbi:hypothetical protein D3C87_1649610 [compost metagenome]